MCAMTNAKPVETIMLGNGLVLEIYDHSRKAAGDRWLVKLVARIDIPIDRLSTETGTIKPDDIRALKASCGNYIRYEQKLERNFIDGKQKNAVFQGLMTSYLNGSQSYLSHPDFAKRCALREYRRRQERNTWYREGSHGEEKP
jgi:hypothetical protein